MTKQNICTSRLLILQSKRLMLTSLERRQQYSQIGRFDDQIARLRVEIPRAQHLYRASVLSCGPSRTSTYWTIAYSRLIEVGTVVVDKLRRASPDLPPEERYHVAADVEALEGMLEKWSDEMRQAMASVA